MERDVDTGGEIDVWTLGSADQAEQGVRRFGEEGGGTVTDSPRVGAVSLRYPSTSRRRHAPHGTGQSPGVIARMVDVTGHLGMALLWLAPAWFLLDYRKTAWTFVVSGVLFGMLPDIDLVLEGIFPTVKHHGVFHTILAVTLIAAVIGPVVGKVVEAIAGGTDWLSPEAAARSVRFGSWRSGSPDSPTSSRICSRRRTSPIPSNRSGRSTRAQSVSISSGTTTL